MIDAMTKHLICRLRANHGQEDGDPDRAAQVILDVVDLDVPSLRLRRGPEVGLPSWQSVLSLRVAA
jgi:hypothetical protein